jgi:hypothetical protein
MQEDGQSNTSRPWSCCTNRRLAPPRSTSVLQMFTPTTTCAQQARRLSKRRNRDLASIIVSDFASSPWRKLFRTRTTPATASTTTPLPLQNAPRTYSLPLTTKKKHWTRKTHAPITLSTRSSTFYTAKTACKYGVRDV